MIKKVNFNLGSRRLTEEEAAVVQRATELFISSLGRHRKEIAGSEVFDSIRETTSRTTGSKDKAATALASKAGATKPKSAAKPAAKTSSTGSASWTSNKVAPAIRKY